MVTKLVILLVIVLGVVALAQLMRVYELSSKLSQNKESDISNRDNRLNAKLMLGFMVFLFVSVIWMMLKFGWTGRGVAASEHGAELDWLLNLNLVIIIAVFFLTNFLLFWFAFKYVRKPGVAAFYYPHNNKLEMLWTAVPATVLAIIIILGLRSWNNATDKASPEAIRVELFSKQYEWVARYSGEDNKLGKFDYKLTDESGDFQNPLALLTTATIDTAIIDMQSNKISGIDALEAKLNDPEVILSVEDREKLLTELANKQKLIRLLHQMKQRHDPKDGAAAMDDFTEDTLFLCVNKEYELTFRSKDVIHSAFFPHFRVQMNTVPGQTTRFKFKPTITTKEMKEIKKDENFGYILMCNKICGGGHYKMSMPVVVLDEASYDKWFRGEWKDMNGDGKEDLIARGKIHEATFAHTYYSQDATPTWGEQQGGDEPANDEEAPEGDDTAAVVEGDESDEQE